MLDFVYAALPVKVVFAKRAVRERLPELLDELGAQRLLLVVSPAEQALACELVTPFTGRIAGAFTEVRPHVPVEVAEQARAVAASVDADAILSIGGGSTTGTAKAIALTTGLPVIAVPTTYAGSEVTPVWGLTENGRKTTGRDPRVLPRVVVYDPELTVSLPAQLSAVSGLNALAHCIEAFWGPGANPVTSLIAEEGIRALSRGLPAVVEQPADLDARAQALYGAWLAGTAFATAGSGLHHKVCHVLGGAYDLPHAETHAIVLPHATALVAPAVPGVNARVATALGAPSGTDAGDALAALSSDLGAPTALREIGLEEAQLPEATRLVAEQAPAQPGDVGLPEIEALLRAAWRGDRPSTTARSNA
ncbi:MAG TPA: maleylacetate reductase [Conexibacter sp.]